MALKVIHSSRNLTGHAGLLAIGHCLNHFTQLPQAIDPVLPVRAGIANSDVLRAYVGLLSMGKSDFDAIENHRDDDFFLRALGLGAAPSAPTLRQRLDELATKDGILLLLDELSVRLLKRAKAPITPLPMGHVALDMDVFCMDNSSTKKEGVSRTYAGYDGYAPIAAYLGTEGWCLAAELRDGSQHSAKETHYTLQRVLPRAVALTDAPLLLRMDAGFDSQQLTEEVLRFEQQRKTDGGAAVDLLVKWNPRQQGHELIDEMQTRTDLTFTECREGKRQAIWVETITQRIDEQEHQLYRHLRVTERTIDKHGQQLLIPQWEIEGWVTSLTLPTTEIIALRRSRHPRAIPQRVQDGYGHRATAVRQIRHQRCHLVARYAGLQLPAADRPECFAGTEQPGASSRQTPPLAHRHAGNYLPCRVGDTARKANRDRPRRLRQNRHRLR